MVDNAHAENDVKATQDPGRFHHVEKLEVDIPDTLVRGGLTPDRKNRFANVDSTEPGVFEGGRGLDQTMPCTSACVKNRFASQIIARFPGEDREQVDQLS